MESAPHNELEALKAYGDLRIDDVFTQTFAHRLGHGKYVAARVQSLCKNYAEWDDERRSYVTKPIITLAQLACCYQTELLRLPYFGRKAFNFAREGLAHHGLKFNMESAKIYCNVKE